MDTQQHADCRRQSLRQLGTRCSTPIVVDNPFVPLPFATPCGGLVAFFFVTCFVIGDDEPHIYLHRRGRRSNGL